MVLANPNQDCDFTSCVPSFPRCTTFSPTLPALILTLLTQIEPTPCPKLTPHPNSNCPHTLTLTHIQV